MKITSLIEVHLDDNSRALFQQEAGDGIKAGKSGSLLEPFKEIKERTNKIFDHLIKAEELSEQRAKEVQLT